MSLIAIIIAMQIGIVWSPVEICNNPRAVGCAVYSKNEIHLKIGYEKIDRVFAHEVGHFLFKCKNPNDESLAFIDSFRTLNWWKDSRCEKVADYFEAWYFGEYDGVLGEVFQNRVDKVLKK